MKRYLPAVFLGTCVAAGVQAAPKPNIVLIVADDLGYGDLSVHGCKEFSTPHIDSIAQAGIRFTNGYVTCPVCAPSRAGLMSGRYQDRFGFTGNPEPGAKWGLPAGEQTIASMLKAAGYRTAAVGKWHLGEEAQYRPTARGFDEFYGFLSGMHSYFKAEDPRWGPIVRGDAEPAKLDKYLTFKLADEACAFVESAKDNPFFLYLAFNAPHTPMEAPPEYLAKTKHIKDSRRTVYAAMVMALDDAVGQVLKSLHAAGVEENTLIVFLSDNGGATIDGSERNGSSNAPLRGSKAQLWEGGIRVPFFISWPGKFSAGQVIDTPIISLDLFPTFAALTGTEAPAKADGLDLSELLRGEIKSLPPRDFFWRFFDTQAAVRSGDLKWIRLAPDRGLYNLSEDCAEASNLIDHSGSEVEKLRSLWQVWDQKNIRQILP